jgi:UDP-GlcNAc:undecaprenyl-phosphate/decaprenyl-phosphate GlcNAc-1-phosphate transferase
MTVRSLAFVAVAAAAVAGLLVFPRLLESEALRKKNFRGASIPSAYGVYLAFYAALGGALVCLLGLSSPRVTTLYVVVITGMATLGLLDDLFGARDAGGFRGHFKKLLLERKFTTGAFKAIGGGVFALGVAWFVSESTSEWLVNALLIALSANALNLLDVRPGRALAGFVIGLIFASGVAGFALTGWWPLAALLIPTVALAGTDVTGRAMMGDTGSNALGGAVGLTLAIDGPPAAKIAAVVLLLALHLFCEKYSLTEVVEKNLILRKLDSLLGVR